MISKKYFCMGNELKYIQYFMISFITILLIPLNFEQSVYSTTNETNSDMFSSTNGGSLDVQISALPTPIISQDETKFKITFFEPNSTTVQVHVDYDLIVSSDNQEIFSASKLTGQPLLHTAEGIVTIPYKFEAPGIYNIKVPVLGINFVPINPEFAEFEVQVK